MKSLEIKGAIRTDLGTKYAIRLRREGLVPCVVYGGEDPIHFSTNSTSFRTLAYTPDVYAVTINLEGSKSVKAVMTDIQFHPVTDAILHVDFMELVDGKAVQVDIPIALIGASRGVKNGGRLKQNLRKLAIKALPKNMPAHIEVDITELRIGFSIKVEDLSKSGDFEFINSGGAVIVSVATSRKVVAEDEIEGAGGASEATEAAAEA